MKQSLDSSPIHHKLCVCTVSAVLASKVGETKYRRKKLSSSHFPSLAAVVTTIKSQILGHTTKNTADYFSFS